MIARKRILSTATLIMVCLSVVVTTTGTIFTYRSALAEKQAELLAITQREVQVLEAAFKPDAYGHSPKDHESKEAIMFCPICSGKIASTLDIIKKLGNFKYGWGPGVEFVVAVRDAHNIRFLLHSKHPEGNMIRKEMVIPWESKMAEPMRLALSGRSGIIKAADYRGKAVLAAYVPVKMLGWGVVAKIDMTEMRAPFVSSVRNSLVIAALAILVGLLVLRSRLKPLIQLSQDSEEQALAELRNQKLAMDEHSIVAITDPSGTITYANDRTCQVSRYSREELIGQNYRIVNSGHHPRVFFSEIWQTITAGKIWHGEICNRAKDGSLYWAESTIVPFKNKSGRITRYVAIGTDISRSKLDSERLSIALSTMRGGSWDWNIETGEVIFSAEWCRSLGYEPTEVNHHLQFWERCVHPDDMDKVQSALQTHFLGQSSTYECENRLRMKDGTYRWNLDRGRVVTRSEDGEPLRMVGMDIDISEQKSSEEQLRKSNEILNEAKAAAQAADRAKSEFLANMSHEIRTPMAAILGYADLLLKEGKLEKAPKGRIDAINTIRKNGRSLLDLINDILDLSKIEAGKLSIERSDCQPNLVVADVTSLMHLRAEVKGLDFEVEYEGAIPETIHSNPARLRQILINLIGNAIKFTEAGSIRLVTRLVEDGDKSCLQFDVVDTGCGMTQEQVARLFQPFTQADTSTTRKFGGTGLGLTISQRFAKLLGGDITVSATRVGVGSTFRAWVTTGSLSGVNMLNHPMSVAEVADSSDPVTHISLSDLQGCRILLAEDNPDNHRIISCVLEEAGADVTVRENGQLAMDIAMTQSDRGTPFDVILMDMQMPIMDGYKATSQLRQQGYTKPIIALTAHAMSGDHEKCIDIGCDGYLAKPMDWTKLIDTIRSHAKS